MENVDFSLNKYYLESSGKADRLRVGVLIESRLVPRFVYSVLADLTASRFVKLSRVFVESDGHAANALSWSGGNLPRVLGAYYRSYDRRERRLPDALESTDILPALAEVPRTELSGSASSAFPDDDLDLILCFGSRMCAERLAPLAKRGAWIVEYGRSRSTDIASALLADFSAGVFQTPIRIRAIDAQGGAGDVVVDVGLSTRARTGMADNVSCVLWSMQHLFIQAMRKLHAGSLRLTSVAGEAPGADGRAGSFSHEIKSLRWIASAALRRTFRRLLRGPRRIEWQIAIRRSSRSLLEDVSSAALREFKWLAAEPGHFWADPFLFESEGSVWLFYEDYPYATGRAVISCGRLSDDGQLVERRVVLDRPYHLSYPNVFEWNGGLWMLPETTGAGQVELYRGERFPDVWVLERVLLPFRATDPTIAFVDDRWWLLVSPLPVQGQTATMLLFQAETPLGPWHEVSASPVSTDARFARGAGQLFRRGGQLIRPSQDCARTYGYSVGFSRVDVLAPDCYQETILAEALPRGVPGVQRLHTYTRVRDWEAIDGFRYTRPGKL